MVSLLITAVVIALVIIYLDPIDTLKVVIGLGLVIFIHELGHFLAAKWCDVHVKTFCIGFGPAVPFCSYKWGETTYMVGIIPLGGYVKMVGEGDNAGEEDAEEDPRSFRKKTVGQRMLIISAGVIMNIILGMACFVAAYLHGVQEKPATVGWVESGGAAWRAGDAHQRRDHQDRLAREAVLQRHPPDRDEPRRRTRKSNSSSGTWTAVPRRSSVEPLKDEGVRFPQVGIAPPYRLTLLSIKKKGFKPVIPGSAAADANDPGFEPGDRIVAMTDPDNPAQIKPLQTDPKEPSLPDINDYYQRMEKLAGKPVTFRVVRKDSDANPKQVEITVQPAYRADLGVRMRMGEVVALRRGGPAEKAGVEGSYRVARRSQGDKIKMVKLPRRTARKPG